MKNAAISARRFKPFSVNRLVANSKEELSHLGLFDVIKYNVVLEHVYQPNDIVRHIHSLLADTHR